MTMRTRGLKPESVAGLLAAYTAIALNLPFWRELLTITSVTKLSDVLFVGALGIVVIAILWCLYGALAWPRLFKPAAIGLMFIAASASYHTGAFGTLYDQHMIANILQTDRGEARDLMTLNLFLHVGLLAGLPSALLLLCRIDYRPFASEVRAKAVGSALLIAAMVASVAAFSSHIIPMAREHVKLRYAFAPVNVIAAVISYAKPSAVLAARKTTLEPIAATKGAAWSGRGPRSITVLVVGETARAGNFSLNGYPRATNAALSQIDDIVSFKKVESCGTATAQSLPCMFSDLGMARFSAAAAASRENLTDVLQRAGFTMLWRDNQSGCKGICLRIPHENTNTVPKEFYKDSDTLDDALLSGLETWIDRVTGHGVVVLHMMGSHGPAYYKRYDPAKAPFKPTCDTAQFSSCSNEALVNTYDNSIHYTDQILARLISTLKSIDARGVATAMLYVSDHGESLGERGVYLHGLPRTIAPIEQTHVPWITWLSPRFQRDNRIDTTCLQRQDARPLSHDYLFHSVLGLLDVDSPAYRRDRDAYVACRRGNE
jgi:lipid A ethanolaminephosphotransferase